MHQNSEIQRTGGVSPDDAIATIDQGADLWHDLSPKGKQGMKAKIHRWMYQNQFTPKEDVPPRSRKPCKLSVADLTFIAILHWAWFVGVTQSVPFNPYPGTSALDDTPKRRWQLFLLRHKFKVAVHIFPMTDRNGDISRTQSVTFVAKDRIKDDENFLTGSGAVPRTVIDVEKIYFEVQRRIKKMGLKAA